MRIIIDIMIGLMLVAVVVAVVVMRNDKKLDVQAVEQVQAALDRLHDQANYHTALQSAKAGQDTLLVHMHESWFGEQVPENVLLTGEHPWIDLAPPGDLGVHPPDPVATERSQAGFWYNPTTGVFRARVTPRSTEADTLALYNEINGTELAGFEQMPDPTRRPIAHILGKTPAKQYASMANLTWSKVEPREEPAEPAEPVVEEDPEKIAEAIEQIEVVDPGDAPIYTEPLDSNPIADVPAAPEQPEPEAVVEPSRPTLKK